MILTEIPSPTLIAEGTRVQGALTFYSSTQVFGIVDGELIQQSLEMLQIGRTGWVNGNIAARGPILIEGRVDGNVESSTQIRILPTATIRGCLKAPVIEIRAGALFDGELKMQAAEPKHRKKAA